MIAVTTIIGARPQFIKASTMSAYFRTTDIISEVLIHTGQHFDHNMSDVFFSQLGLPVPEYNLGINSSSHGRMTGEMIIQIEEILIKTKPNYVLVYGDTNSTIAGALAARKLHIPIIHVEAGLRSNNEAMPEETNRIVTDRLSALLCCPTDTAVENLRREGFDTFNCSFRKTGDIMEDSLRYYLGTLPNDSPLLDELGLTSDNFILCTVHRAENTDDPKRMQAIMDALHDIADECVVVLPVHPRTRARLSGFVLHPNLKLIEPVGYLDNLQLIRRCSTVITDSGGLQKEAFMLKKFCVTLRDETEWKELVDLGANVLAGANHETILSSYNTLKGRQWDAPDDIYGGGNARHKIFDMILSDASQRSFI